MTDTYDQDGYDSVREMRGDNDIDVGDGGSRIKTGSGDDTITAGDGYDRIDAGRGDNQIDVGDGGSYIRTQHGDDTITAGDGYDVVRAGSGDNVIDVGDGGSRIYTGHGDDVILSDDGYDVVFAGSGDNLVDAGDGGAFIVAGSGDDTIRTGDGFDFVYAGSGNNDVDTGAGGSKIIAGSGDDKIETSDGWDFVNAGHGDNEINIGDGGGFVVSGRGADEISLSSNGWSFVHAGSGDDRVTYTIEETQKFSRLFGGYGQDTLVLDLPLDVYKDEHFQNEIAYFLENKAPAGRPFYFCSLNLYVHSFENVEIVVGGVTLDPIDQDVVANSDAASLREDDGPVLQASVLDNDDAPNGVASVVLDTAPAKGVLVFNQDGTYSFDPNDEFEDLAEGETEEITFTYAVTDLDGDTSIATVTLTVIGDNDTPFVANGSLAASEDAAPVNFDLSSIGSDVDSDDDGSTLTYSITGTPSEGSASISGTTLTFDPASDFQDLGKDETREVTVTVTAEDAHGATYSADVTITVTGTNDVPVASADTNAEDAVVEQGAIVAGDATAQGNVLANDTDVDANDTLVVTSVAAGAATGSGGVGALVTGTYGSVQIAQDGSYTYLLDDSLAATDALAPGQVVTDVFTYQVSDGNGGVANASLTISITGSEDNRPPTAQADATIIGEADLMGPNAPANVTFNVLADNGNGADGDPDGDAIAVTGAGGVAAGAAFQVTTSSSVAAFSGLSLLASVAANGDVSLETRDGSGAFIFDGLGGNESASVSFDYTIADPLGETSTATATITFQGTEDAPVITGATSAQVSEDGTLAASGILTVTDADVSDTPAFVAATMNSAFGSFSIDAAGNWDYALDNSAAQSIDGDTPVQETFTVEATTADGESVQTTFTITIAGEEDGPVISGATSGGVTEDTALSASGSLSASDADAVDTAVITPQSGTAGTYGTFTVDNAGNWSYSLGAAAQALAEGQMATETFTVSATTADGESASVSVSIAVTGTNDDPVAQPITAEVGENASDFAGFSNFAGGAVIPNSNYFYAVDYDTGEVTEIANGLAVFTQANAVAAYGPTNGLLINVNPNDNDFEISIISMVDGVAANVDVAGLSVTSEYSGATSSRRVLGFEYFQFLDTVDGTDIKIDAVGVPSSNGPTDVSLSLLNPFFYDGISGELAIDSLLVDVVASQAPGTVTVTADFTDVDATDTHSFSVDATATNGTVTDNGDGTFSYSTNGHYDYLGAGEEATDTFTYTVLDQAGGSDTKTVTITVTGTNDVPVAVAGSATVEERVSQTISVLPLVTEIDSTDTPVYFIDDSLTIGSVTDNGDGTFEYDPAGNFNGLAKGETAQDIVVFVVDDGNGGTAFNTVTITIEGANERPVVIGSQSFSTNEDSAVSELNLLANASDANGDTIGVTELQVTASDGRPVAFAYDSGSDSFSLDPSQFNDLGGDESVEVTVSYNVFESDRSFTGADAGARSLTNSGTFYISDSDSGALHIVERGVNGVASFEDALQALSDSGISVTNGTALLLDENGGATSGLAVSARSIGNGVVSVAEADVDLAGYTGGITTASTVPPSYVAFFDAFTATTLTVTVTQPDIRCGPSEHVFTFSDVSQTAGKEVDIASMTLNVAALGAEVSEVITIMGVNDAPEATAKSVTIDEDGSINVAVLQGATDADGDNVGLDSVTQGANGSVVIDSDGTVTYEANADFNGTDSFTFTLSDGNGGTVTETVNVTVNAVNDAPVTDSESVSLDEDSSVNIAVLDGDTDVDGDVLTVDSVTQGANGSVAIQTDGTVTYTANANYNGTDSFTYTVSDGNGALVTETVNVTVNPVNDAPIANALSGEVTESATVTELTGAIEADSLVPNLGRFYLFDFDTGATTTVLRDTGSSNTEAQVASQHFSDGNGVVIHINPNVDGWGIAFALFDNEGQVDVLASDLTVTGSAAALPSAPGDISLAFANGAQNVDEISLATQITLSDGRVVDFDAALFGIDYEVNTTDDLEVDAARFNAVITDPSTDEITLTADFTDVEVGDSHTFSVNDSGTLGSVINNGDGTFTYSANGQFEHLSEGETATDSFDYIVNDGNGGTSTATATITIFGQNDGPVTSNVNAGSVEEDDAAVTIDLLANATDAENDALTVSGISLSDGTGSPVSFTDNGDGTIDIDPSQYSALESGESATITVTYTVSDGAVSVQGTAQLVVNGATPPTPPVAVDDDFTASAVTDEDTTYVFSAAELVGNDSDVNGDTLSVASVSSFSTLGATVVLNGDGTVSYAPGSSATLDALASGDTLFDSFTYVVSDGNGGTDTATVSLQISGVNDAPILTNSLVAQSGFTADAFSYTLPSDLFTDHDENGAITYSVTLDDGSPLPSFLNFDAATRTLSYAANAPAVSDIGLYSLQVTATEVDGQFSTTGFTLTVLDGTLISGTSASEVLNGTIQGDLMRGLGGNDTLNGLSSSDVMDGGEGNDRLNGDAGDDVLIGGAGNDYLFGEEGNDNLFGGDDNDYLDQGDGTGLLDGGAGNDTLRASYDSEGSSETLIGGDGDDTIQTVGWRSTDVVDAGAGNDYVELRGYGFNGDEGGGTITLGTGADVLNLSNGHNLSQYSVFRVTDFNVAEDIVRIDDFLNSRLSGWDGVTNPFAAGYMQLVDDGAGNAVLQVDTNGGGDSYQDVIVFEGLAASSLTGLNFDSAWPPDGSLPAGRFITGTTGNDNITGTIGGDTIEALEGNDTLNGAAGSDSLDGGDGADQIRGDAGADTILGGEGNDFLYGQEGNDDIFGGDGRDYLFQDRGYGTLDGGAGDDYIYASTDSSVNNATQTLIGGAGNDVFYNVGRYSVDTVDAGADNDTVNLNGYGYSATRMGGAIVTLGAGADRLLLGANTTVNAFVTFSVTDFNVSEDVFDFDSFLEGSRITGWDGASNPFGAAGYFQFLNDGLGNTLFQVDTNGGGDNFVTVVTFEGLAPGDFLPTSFVSDWDPSGAAPVGVNILGTASSETFTGSTGADAIIGEGGNDYIYGEAGNDVLTGGAGSDNIFGGVGSDSITGGSENDRLYGDAGDDTIHGNDGDDYLYQNNGTGLLDGGEGSDRLYASTQYLAMNVTETLIGGGGNDFIYDAGYYSTDVVDAGSGDDFIRLRLQGNSAAEGKATITLGTGADQVEIYRYSTTPSAYVKATFTDFDVAEDSILFGDFLTQRLSGWDGSSNPFGSGIMRIIEDPSNPGSSILQIDSNGGGDNFIDYLVFEGVASDAFSSGNFIIDAATSQGYAPDGAGLNGGAQIAGAGGEALTGSVGDDTLLGAAGADTLTGGNGADELSGEGGDDEIAGGFGDDTMEGGVGADRFVFTLGSGNDQIADFTVGTDQLVLSGGQSIDSIAEVDTDGVGGVDSLMVQFQDDSTLLLGNVLGVTDFNDLF